MDEREAHQWLRSVVRTEMVRQNLTYAELLRRLNTIGVKDSETNLRNKIGRGKFSALLMIQCLEMMGVENLRLDMLEQVGCGNLKPRNRKYQKWAAPSDALGELIEEEVSRIEQNKKLFKHAPK